MIRVGRFTRGFGLAAALALTSGVAEAQHWTIQLSGQAEAPHNAPRGTGNARVVLTGRILTMTGSFTGLTGTTTVTYLQCYTATPRTGEAGVATTTPTFT